MNNNGVCENNTCTDPLESLCCEDHTKTEQQCYSHKTHLCCGINKHNYRHDNDDVDDANDGEAYINETGPLACSISAPNCCVWEQIGNDKSLTFIKKCCEHCCSSIPGECDHNCTSCDGLGPSVCKEVGCRWCGASNVEKCMLPTEKCGDSGVLIFVGTMGFLILLLIIVVLGIVLKSKFKKYRRNKLKQALRKKVENEKLNSYASILCDGSIENGEDEITKGNGKRISRKSIVTPPVDFDNTYKDSDIAQKQYNENLFRKSRSQRAGSLALSSNIYSDEVVSTDSDVCNDIISIPHSMVEYENEIGSLSNKNISDLKSNSKNKNKDGNGGIKENPSTSIPYFSKLLKFRNKNDKNDKKGIVPPRFDESSSWKPRRKVKRKKKSKYVHDVKPKKITFPQSLDQSLLDHEENSIIGNSKKCVVIYKDDDDDDNEMYYSGSLSSSSNTSDSSSSSSSSTQRPFSDMNGNSSPSSSSSTSSFSNIAWGGGRIRMESSCSPTSSPSPTP